MAPQIDMVLDFQYGSTGKGLLAGYLAKRRDYDTAICAFATNAGHTYIDKKRGIHMMTQQLPTAISSPTVKNILIGPGAAICAHTLRAEISRYGPMLDGKTILIHPQAAVVDQYHADYEMQDGRTKMGSTAKGVGEAYIERMRRDPRTNNTVGNRWRDTDLGLYVATEEIYREAVNASENLLIEGAQGFSLSLYHGQYPYVTSRDVTPWQVAADCGLPFKWAPHIKIMGTLRTMPIRVNNRDGSSGPCYDDQLELDWATAGVPAELTTVTKLPRRLFTFSQKQLDEALFHCGSHWNSAELFLNFCNYVADSNELQKLVDNIQNQTATRPNPPTVKWLGWGPDDANVQAWGA